jgi:putative spermidine/putrescine transport system ATP-binding protein
VSSVELEGISKRFGTIIAVERVDLTFAEGSFTALLGPSGCGKSTLLRLIAGLEQPDEGRVRLDQRDVTGIPPEGRDVGMMFQSYALFPHMSVAGNLAFPLKMKGMRDRRAVAAKVAEALALVRLSGIEARSTRQLSGGQQQRVALARAFVAGPRVLLLDEPLSNLDARLRQEMQVELIDLHKTLGLTTIFVTHDQEEALSLADHVVLMCNGGIEQQGPPEQLYGRPRTPFAADFIGAANLIPAEVRQAGDTGFEAVTASGLRFPVTAPADGKAGPRRIMIRQEDVRLHAEPGNELIALPCTVQTRIYRGASVRFVVQLADEQLVVMAGREVRLTPGSRAYACWRIEDAAVL